VLWVSWGMALGSAKKADRKKEGGDTLNGANQVYTVFCLDYAAAAARSDEAAALCS
jgi:hypothetical protein